VKGKAEKRIVDMGGGKSGKAIQKGRVKRRPKKGPIHRGDTI